VRSETLQIEKFGESLSGINPRSNSRGETAKSLPDARVKPKKIFHDLGGLKVTRTIRPVTVGPDR